MQTAACRTWITPSLLINYLDDTKKNLRFMFCVLCKCKRDFGTFGAATAHRHDNRYVSAHFKQFAVWIVCVLEGRTWNVFCIGVYKLMHLYKRKSKIVMKFRHKFAPFYRFITIARNIPRKQTHLVGNLTLITFYRWYQNNRKTNKQTSTKPLSSSIISTWLYRLLFVMYKSHTISISIVA